MIQRIKMNFKVQHIWPLGAGGGGSYRNYHIVNAARKEKNQSKGEAFMDRNLYSKVVTGVGGNTMAIYFFFRYYLFFVDWGVGVGQKVPNVPENGIPKMKRIYAEWRYTGDRQRRPVVQSAIRGSRFFLGKMLEDYWDKEVNWPFCTDLDIRITKGSSWSLRELSEL